MRQQFSRYSGRKARERRFGGYHADAVHFDGAAAFLSRGAALTGATGNYQTCLFSIWAKFANTTAINITKSGGNGLFFLQWAGGPSQIFLANFYDADFNGDGVEVDGAPQSGVWLHILISYDGSDLNKCRALINGANATDAEFFNTGPATLTGETNFYVGRDGAEGAFLEADVADYYLAIGQWLDLADPANVAKFIADGKPVDLGSDGSTPTGTAPTIFFSGDASGFVTNRGTGGAFTLTGELTNAASSPSD